MKKEIDELQAKIGINLDIMIPTDYKVAWVFYELGPKVAPSFWFCYIEASTGKIIPADCIDRRKDIVIKDFEIFKNARSQIIFDVQKLQKEYAENFGKQWYGITYQLNADGAFDITFSYEKPTGSLQERREKWCMEHLGIMPPEVTVDMLRK